MKKKILITALLVMLLACLFTIVVSAEATSSKYAIQFNVKLSGGTDYTPVYTANDDNDSPRITFSNGFFLNATFDESTSKYTFTDVVDQSQIVEIDFSSTTTLKSKATVIKDVRKSGAATLTNCEKVTWFAVDSGCDTSLEGTLFSDWTSLKTFDFGCVTEIGDSSFSGCGFVELVIPETVLKILNSSFINCASLKTVTIDGSPSVGLQTFQGCEALESANMPKITTLGTRMFKNCKSLQTVNAPNVTVMKEEAIGSTCTSLTTLTINYSVLTQIEKYAFQNLTCLPSELDISNATSIGTSAFKGCTGIESVKFSKSPITIGESAFNGCTGLTGVLDISSATSIGKEAFKGCTGITKVTIPSCTTSIGNGAFSSCTGLTTAVFEEKSSLTALNGSTFSNCSALSSVNLPEGITKLGNDEFYKTGAISLHIPSTVEYIGCQFAEGSGLVSLTFAENSKLTHIDHRAFRECLSLADTVVIPEGVEDIEYGLFYGCTSLKAVKLPSTFNKSTEGGSLFSGCTALEFVQMSGCVATIPSSMFENCYALKAISFPEGVKAISYKALRSCTSLQAVYLPSSLTSLGKSSDNTASDWGVFYQSPNVYLVNEPFDVFEGDSPLGDNFVMPEKPEVYYMPEGLTVVGNSEFQNCTNLNNFIVFPVGVQSMADCGQGAFCGIGSGRASNPVTLVFLGDITDLRIRQNDTNSSNVHFVFANPNDTGITSLNFTVGAANNKLQTNTYAYFCASNTVYDLTTFKAANGSLYTILEGDFTKTVNTDETQPHFHSPRADATKEATCTLPAGSFTFCFCGKVMTSDIVEGSVALGHISEGAELTIYYPTVNDANGNAVINYFANAYHSFLCQREGCGKTVDEQQPNTALFTEKGYSKENGGNTFTYGIKVNKEAKEAYVANGNIISYGFIVGAYSEDTTGAIINADGTTTLKTVVMADLSKANLENFTIYNVKMKDLTSDQKSQSIYCCGYVIDDGEVSYLGETVTKVAGVISYDAIPADTTSTDESESA